MLLPDDYSGAAVSVGCSATTKSDRDDLLDDLRRPARGIGGVVRGGLPNGCRASRSVDLNQARNGSRSTRTRLPERTKHSSGISLLHLRFWTVRQLTAPPVNSSTDVPAKTGGSAFSSSSMTRCVNISKHSVNRAIHGAPRSLVVENSRLVAVHKYPLYAPQKRRMNTGFTHLFLGAQVTYLRTRITRLV